MQKRLLFLSLLLLFAFPAFAADSLFMKPYVSEMQLSSFSGAEQNRAREALEKGVELQTAFYQKWTVFFNVFTAKRQQMTAAADSGNWELFKTLLAENVKAVGEIEALAKEYSQLSESQNFEAFIRQDYAYLAQNTGLQPSGDFQAIIAKALEGENKDKVSTFASGYFSQVYQRGFSLAESAGKVIGEKPLSDFRASLQQQKTLQAAKDTGSTKEGYFTGFFDRLKFAGTGMISYIVLTVLFGLWMGGRTGIANLWSVALFSALLLGVPLVLVYTVFPFLPGIAFIAAFFILFLALWSMSNERKERIFPAWIAALLQKGTPPPAAQQVTHGSAAWGTAEHAARAGHIAPKEPSFALGRLTDALNDQDNRFRFLGHITTCAPTGAGKGIGAVIPNLLEYPGSALVLDIKGENYAVTARQRRTLGHKVFCVDPFNVTGSGGNCFNVLDRVDLNSPDCVGEAAAIAENLVIRSHSRGENSGFFDESAQNYLQALILYVKTLAPERQNLREVRRFVNAAGEEFTTLLANMVLCQAGYEVVSRMGNAMSDKPEKERGSILSTAQMHTAFLDDPRIADTLSRSDFNLGQLKTEPMSIYLVLPPSRLANNARFVRAFIGSALAAITSSDKKPRFRVAFLLDEFPQLGYMRQIEDAISLVRGYGVVFWIFLQDLSQLKGVYEKWQTFLANSGKVFFGTSDFDTAKYISDSLGEKTIDYQTVGHSVSDRSASTSHSQQITARNLLTPDEVMRQGPERPIVLIPGEYPYMLHRLNYLVDPEYQGLFDANPYHA
jgi:type IV secretion system protein VirD4